MLVSRRAFLASTGGAALVAFGGSIPAHAAIRGIDHLPIMFKELEPAIAAYRDLGFTVVPGGEHPSGTHNALVTFADGAYLELIAFKRPNEQHRWWGPAQAGGGFIDFCMATDDLAADIRAFRDAGVNMGDPIAGGRVRPDGYKLSWVVASAPKSYGFEVAFLIEDRTPREERIGKETTHPNGVIGVAGITLATNDVARARGWWRAALNQPGVEIKRDDIDAAGVRFTAGANGLDFVSPNNTGSPLTAWLRERGPSPYAMTLKTRGHKSQKLDEAKAGARITLVEG